MPAADPNTPSSAKTVSSSVEEELAYYKAQYEQLEIELADFQASSRELEAELEKDIEASEKRERQLKEKVESLKYEVEEWKTKYKQAKSEANTVQSTLQKEITTLREANRALQLRIRDIEVANDDYERQARNTTSSLEDLESKYNVAIERGVLLEEEIKNGEQEREALRIEAQRLRDELSDLKIEADIVNEKLRKAEAELSRRRKPSFLNPAFATSQYPDGSVQSPGTSTSSPTTLATPPAKSVSSATSDAVSPPSPTASEPTASVRKQSTDSFVPRARSITNSSTTGRPRSGYRKHNRTPSIPQNGNGYSTPSIPSRQSFSRPNASQSGIPRSGSLYQIRGLIGKMQKLEERVHSARSRLPAPVDTPSGASPRTPAAMDQNSIPSSVTVRKGSRSSRKRTSGSSASSSVRDTDGNSSSFIPQSRLSFGRPSGDSSRPSSRTSFSSRSSVSHSTFTSGIPQPCPESYQSLNRARTPLGHYSTNPTTEGRRPRSSLSSYAPDRHGGATNNMSYIDEDSDIMTPAKPPRRGSTLDHVDAMRSSIPTPGSMKKRPSAGTGGVTGIPAPRKISSGLDRKPQGQRVSPQRKNQLTDLGETY
ncbi:hypothetical protein VTN77DRAFT_6165 [Rasamsonia byssochlamydoides]|uniref:uncharacterized protein n=1 Tax=Rasamsonia byssochlamydoides TaxID=89139 RepID=UPI003743507B